MSVSLSKEETPVKHSKETSGATFRWVGAAIGAILVATFTIYMILSNLVGANAANISQGELQKSMTNTANHILQGTVDGDIKDGDNLESLYDSVPDAFVAPAGIQMAIVYNPTTPNQFALCGWGADSSDDGMGTSKSSAIAYKSVGGNFSPMAINCTDSPDGAAAVDIDLRNGDSINAERPNDLVFNVSEGEEIPVEVPVEEAPVDEIPVDVPVEETPVEEADPVVIPWAGIIITAVALIAFGVLIALISAIYRFSRKVKADAQVSTHNTNQWKALVERYDSVVKEWASYELDPVKMLDFPLLSNMREETTIEFHKALRKAKNLRPSDVRKVSAMDANTSPFAQAVESLENAFHTAEVEAKRIKWSNFTADERKRLQKAKDLLNLAMNSAASDAERQSAYKRMQKEIDGLIVMPKATILALEEKAQLMLTDGSEDEISLVK